jgi:hypothetical protein
MIAGVWVVAQRQGRGSSGFSSFGEFTVADEDRHEENLAEIGELCRDAQMGSFLGAAQFGELASVDPQSLDSETTRTLGDVVNERSAQIEAFFGSSDPEVLDDGTWGELFPARLVLANVSHLPALVEPAESVFGQLWLDERVLVEAARLEATNLVVDTMPVIVPNAASPGLAKSYFIFAGDGTVHIRSECAIVGLQQDDEPTAAELLAEVSVATGESVDEIVRTVMVEDDQSLRLQQVETVARLSGR